MWTQLHKPRTLADIKGHDLHIKALQTLSTCEMTKNPWIMLYGPAGSGKSSASECYQRERTQAAFKHFSNKKTPPPSYDSFATIYVKSWDASQRPDADGFIKQVEQFIVKTLTFSSTLIPLLILEEADTMLEYVQELLACLDDKYTFQLVLVLNEEKGVLPCIQTRCLKFHFQAIPTDILVTSLQGIVSSHPPAIWTKEALTLLVDSCEGDMRRCLNLIQPIHCRFVDERRPIVEPMVELNQGRSRESTRSQQSTLLDTSLQIKPLTTSDISPFLPHSPSMIVYDFLNRLHIHTITKSSASLPTIIKDITDEILYRLKPGLDSANEAFRWCSCWLFERRHWTPEFQDLFAEHLATYISRVSQETDLVTWCTVNTHHWTGFCHVILTFLVSLHLDANTSDKHII